MQRALALLASLLVWSAGCGGGRRYQASSDDWDSTSTSGTSDTTSAADAGLDAAVDGGDPVRDRAMALFARSCTPCHRHGSPVDVGAIETGVYLETPDEILARRSEYTIGNTPTNLPSLIAQRAEGYDLLVGRDGRTPMPPRGSSYAPLTQEEAQQIRAWFDAAGGVSR